LLPQITKLALAGLTQQEIADRVGCVKSTVCNYLAELREECRRKAQEDTTELVARMLARYELVFREALEAWWKSQRDKVSRRIQTEDVVLPECGEECPTPQEAKKRRRSIKREHQAGDASLLNTAAAALKAIREMKGLDAPTRSEIGGPSGGPIQLTAVNDLRNMSDEQLAQLEIEIEARIREEESGPQESALIHDVHQAGLRAQLAPPGPGDGAGSGGEGPVPEADGVHAAAARQERAGEPPLPGLAAGQES
jgi:transcriptional regulator with XRE-family HTH domain